jgi:Flp pilus assembly protein TadG
MLVQLCAHRKMFPGRGKERQGAAAVELAVLLPLLAFLFVIAVDFGRVFYYSVTIETCARNGALYGSDPVAASQSPYKSISEAALADASNLQPQPTVTSTSGTDTAGDPYVEVTVTWGFSTITNYPGVPSSTNLSRTVRMRIAPTTPN